MARRRTETNEEYMDRLRAVRGLPPMRQDPSLMDRTRAAVAYVGTVHSAAHAEKVKLHAFMALFHPEVSPERVRDLLNPSVGGA